MTAVNASRDTLNNSNLLAFFTNVIQWTCLSNYAIPSDVKLTLGSLSTNYCPHRLERKLSEINFKPILERPDFLYDFSRIKNLKIF